MGIVVSDPESVELRSERQALLLGHFRHFGQVGVASVLVALEDSNRSFHA
jgi:hypothetical protein